MALGLNINKNSEEMFMNDGSINKLFKNESKFMLLFLLAPICMGILIAFLSPVLMPFKCKLSDGKWFPSASECISKACAETGRCLPSYNNNLICSSLKTGISRDELYFQLGMPISTNGNWYIFQGGAGEKNVSAIIANGKVESLACGI